MPRGGTGFMILGDIGWGSGSGRQGVLEWGGGGRRWDGRGTNSKVRNIFQD